MPMSAKPKIGAVGSGLIASTVPGVAEADAVVELAARADAHEQARRDRPAGDADLAGARQPALVGDLAGRAELGAEHAPQRLELVVARGVDALADADDGRRRRARRDRRRACRASTSTRLLVVAVQRRRVSGRKRRGASAASMPARTVAIWTGDVQWIAATSSPPNAGFHATSRPSSTSSSTASPVRPRRAAPRRVPRPRGPTSCSARAPPTGRARSTSRAARARRRPRRARRGCTTRSAPRARRARRLGLAAGAERDHVAVDRVGESRRPRRAARR